ncbi:TniQ family protein [Mycolicibacterium sp.]|uniref:TniQ family protein n=1 Tax=Mycolicibacterium sp. TaxID=2320850 RepID=UPI001A1D1864|nr:TniQ family protein [Mycolicibacterium sp.]MBJ7336753.1 TniQ family protein [Mycolicibacterium sp.]
MSVRTLPIRLAPLPGEGLDSYLEAFALRVGVVWADMLMAVGLSPTCRDSSGMYRWLTDLTDTQADGVSTACGVSPSAVRAMTIGHAIPAGLAMVPGRSRFCPQCLEASGGRWQLWWRQRWAFACTHHHCLLADACPHCGRRQRARPRRGDQIPVPELCTGLADTAQNGGRRRCGFPLSTAPTLHLGAKHRALGAQTTIVTATRRGAIADGIYRTNPVAAHQFLTDIAELSRRMHRWTGLTGLDHALPADLVHHHRSPNTTNAQHRYGDALPGVTATSAAIAAVLATDILLCPDIETAGAALRSWISAAHHHGHRPTVSSVTRHAQASTALRSVQLCAMAPFLPPHEQLRIHSAFLTAFDGDVASRRWRHVPAVMWPGIIDVPPTFTIGRERWDTALSVAVAMVGTHATVPDMVVRLGSATTAHSVSHVLRTLRTDHRWPTFLATVISLADALDAQPCPIDYAARRELPFAELLPPRQWRDISSVANVSAAPDIAYRLAQSWLFGQITGSPPRQCPTAPDTSEFCRSLRALPVLVTADLGSTLDQVARQFLDAYGCGHEPLRWQTDDAFMKAAAISAWPGE